MVIERQGRRRGEEGYNMVLLMVIVTALNVLVAAALPAWTAMQQREQEEELIFRGLQYAEAIRVFQARFGRLPVRLEELVEVEPRSIRQLWKDPLTGKPDWGLLFGDPSNPGNCAPSPAEQAAANGGGGSGGGFGLDNGRETVTQGPICGVFSRATGEAIKTFLGSNSYRDWKFTVGLLVQQQAPGQGGAPQPGQQLPGSGPQPPPPGPQAQQGGQPGQPGQPAGQPGLPNQQQLGAAQLQAGIAPDLSMRWIGRPWPEEIEQQMGAPQASTDLGGNVGGSLDDGRDRGSVFDDDSGDDDGEGDGGRRN